MSNFIVDVFIFHKVLRAVDSHGDKLRSFINLLKIVFGQIGSCPTVRGIENCRHIKRMSTTRMLLHMIYISSVILHSLGHVPK